MASFDVSKTVASGVVDQVIWDDKVFRVEISNWNFRKKEIFDLFLKELLIISWYDLVILKLI